MTDEADSYVPVPEATEVERRLQRNATALLQRRHVAAMVYHWPGHLPLRDESGRRFMWVLIVQDWRAGIKLRALAIPDLDDQVDPGRLAHEVGALFSGVDQHVDFTVGDRSTPAIRAADMPLAGRIVIYTNEFRGDRNLWIQSFRGAGHVIDIIDEGDLFKTLFISYGGPDAADVRLIDKALKANDP